MSDGLFILGILLTYVAVGSAIILGGLAIRFRAWGVLCALGVAGLISVLAGPRLVGSTGGTMAAGAAIALISFALLYVAALPHA